MVKCVTISNLWQMAQTVKLHYSMTLHMQLEFIIPEMDCLRLLLNLSTLKTLFQYMLQYTSVEKPSFNIVLKEVKRGSSNIFCFIIRSHSCQIVQETPGMDLL